MSDEVWANAVMDCWGFDPKRLPQEYAFACSRQTQRVRELFAGAWEARTARGGGWADPREFLDELLQLVEDETKRLRDASGPEGPSGTSLRARALQTGRLHAILGALWEARVSRGGGWADPREFFDAAAEALRRETMDLLDAYPPSERSPS